MSLATLTIGAFTPSHTARAQFAVGGVYIDADGVLQQTATLSAAERLDVLRAAAVGQPQSQVLGAASDLRKISLSRLENTVRELHADGQPLPADLRYIAGLQSVQFVFFYPETGDVVLAGPAEGWKQLETGDVVGKKSLRPVLHLDDLIVALRFAFGQTQGASFLGCSIDPTEKGLNEFADYMNRLGGQIDRGKMKEIFSGMEEAMGLQEIRLFGVPRSSRFALTLAAADYRLKRIALGHDPAPVRNVTNYLDLASRGSTVAAQQQHRWWFLAEYDAILHDSDELAFELQGNALKVETAPTQLKPAGGKEPVPNRHATQFATTFTRNVPAIAAKIPIFAELQNLIALSVAAELVARKSRNASAAPAETSADSSQETPAATNVTPTWKPTHFLDESACPIEVLRVPSHVPSIAGYRYTPGKHWLISVSGGVEIQPRKLVEQSKQDATASARLSARQLQAKSPSGRWWWD